MTVKIEVIFIGGRTGNIFVRWPNMFPYLGIEILRSLKSYTTWIEGNWWSSGNEISRCNASLQNPNGFMPPVGIILVDSWLLASRDI
jgi:hypothetical protein